MTMKNRREGDKKKEDTDCGDTQYLWAKFRLYFFFTYTVTYIYDTEGLTSRTVNRICSSL